MVEVNYSEVLFGSVSRMYQLFYRKISSTEDFVFVPSDRDKSIVNSFISLLDKEFGLESIGDDYIYNYFVFQLDYWAGLNTRFGQKIQLSWMIGKKAFSRWVSRIEHDLWHAHKKASEYGIHRGLVRKKRRAYEPLEIIDSEEIEKARFFNEPEGLINCNDNTTLFNHKSDKCSACNWKDACKKILKQELPKIYILRGYMKNEKDRIKER